MKKTLEQSKINQGKEIPKAFSVFDDEVEMVDEIKSTHFVSQRNMNRVFDHLPEVLCKM